MSNAPWMSESGQDGDQWRRAMDLARQDLMAGSAPTAVSSTVVRPAVFDSWRRSRLQGLSPQLAVPRTVDRVDPDNYLCHLADRVVAQRTTALESFACALMMTDHRGVVLRRWGADRRFVDRLDDAGVRPGLSVAEEHYGTSSAIALLAESPVLVRGPEHFLDQLGEFSCAGAPIRNPVTRRTVGTLNFACSFADTNPLMLSWVTDLAKDLERALGENASRHERLLLESYLARKRDCRQPLITLGPHTIITNAAAARLVSASDQAPLWERARSAEAHSSNCDDMLVLANGTTVLVDVAPVHDGNTVIGATLTLKARLGNGPSKGRDAAIPAIAGLVGRSEAWQDLARDATQLPGDCPRALLVGEAGSGRTAVARAILNDRDTRCLDAHERGDDLSVWLDQIADSATGPALILKNIDALSEPMATAVATALRRHDRGRVFATAAAPRLGAPDAPNPVHNSFSRVLIVPPLRDRLDDLGLLLEALTVKHVGSAHKVHWMPDLVQTLARVEWPGNVAELELLVTRLLTRAHNGYVNANDLPSDVLARAARRKLAGLEQGEAQMIMRAIRAAGGNKQQAADALGIARSTLYRKVRSLGLDLAVNAY